MQNKLAGKVAIITGGGRGIGRGMAHLFAKEGAKVVINDVGAELDGANESQSIADQVVREITALGGTATANYDSVATMEGGENIVRTALESFGGLDIVVTPAGILRDRMVFNLSEEEWDAVITVHLKGTFSVVKPACQIFRQQRGGRVITFSSTSGLYGNSGQSNYGAAKDGIAAFTRVVARDMGRYGVTANGIAPSADTRMTHSIPDTTRELRTDQGIQSVGGTTKPVLRREPDDIAPFACWLASDQSSDVNGQIFYVSGGVISLLGHPEPERTLYKNERWTVEQIEAVFPSTLGMDLASPTKSQPQTKQAAS